MVATLCLFTCVLAPAQQADRGDWLLTPHLTKAQELVYRGSYAEEAVGGTVQFQRTYRMETRAFVLDTTPRGADVALFTLLRFQGNKTDRVDPQGKVTSSNGKVFKVPFESPPTVECGVFLEGPKDRIGARGGWETTEAGRPMTSWRVGGMESISGTNCLKIVGVQQSEEWDQPRADRPAWRRKDTVWLAPRLGVAYRVERTIERKEPGRQEPSQRSVLKYELEAPLQYPGQLFDDRRREIVQAHTFSEQVAPLLASPGKYEQQLKSLQGKIAFHLENNAPTPYREAILHVKRHVDAARRGEVLPVLQPASDVSTVAVSVASVGHAAPDFVVPNLTAATSEEARLSSWLAGHQPILMVFYVPTSQTATELLRFAQSVREKYHNQGVVVLGMAVTEDGERVRKQREALKFSFPVLCASSLRQSYVLDATPKLFLIDRGGVVRGAYTGWGSETPGMVTEELRNWLAADTPMKREPAAKK